MEEKLPFAGDIVRTTSVRRLNKLYFAYTDLSPEVQQAYKELILYCGGVEDLLQKSEEFLFYPECHNIMDVARYRLEHNIEFSALSEKGKKYFNLEAYAHELEEKGRYALCNKGISREKLAKIARREEIGRLLDSTICNNKRWITRKSFQLFLNAQNVYYILDDGDEQEKDTGCAWFTLPCNIEALKQSIGLPPDSDRYLISDYDFPFEILQDTDLDLLNNICLAISESEIPPEDIPAIQREWFSNLQELEAGLCNITYHRNCSDMEETSEHFLCVHGRFYEYNE